VLNKLGSLTLEEFQLMQTHTVLGEAVIDKILSRVGDDEFLRFAKLFASCHHERWDGTGYTRGLQGFDIPIQGRILAIVDVFDALTSDREYKRKQTEEEVIEIIRQNRGKLFDPLIVDAFLDVADEIKAARKEYGVGSE
jgi:putative two-component system response regulator